MRILINVCQLWRALHNWHTLACLLLENDTPLPAISDILGHIDTESTAVYLKIDIKRLKECPLDLVEDMS